MRLLLFCLLLGGLGASSASAQIGFSAHYTHTDFTSDYDPQYLEGAWNADRPGTGYRVALDYWFRLKKPRIEFLPTLSYTRGNPFELTRDGVALGELDYQHFSFFFNTNIYLFDLAGDCGCPTFSKGGPALQKGLFLQIGPGVTRERRRTTAAGPDDLLANGSSSATYWGLQAGLGLDIGISDLVTITPLVGVRHYPTGPTLYDVPRQPDVTDLSEPRVWQYFGGLRLGFRFGE